MLFEICDIRMSYGDKVVLNGVDIALKRGEIIGILGKNGAGKTTLLKILSGFIKSDSQVNKVEIIDPQVVLGGDNGFYPTISAYDNLFFFGLLNGMSNKDLKIKINEALMLVNLSDVSKVNVSNFSKGMIQRLHIARGLLKESDVILLDEPTNAIDSINAIKIREDIKKLASLGKGFIITSHVIRDISQLASRIIILDDGIIKFNDTIEELLKVTGKVDLEDAYLQVVLENE